jgi:hypothetical protein
MESVLARTWTLEANNCMLWSAIGELTQKYSPAPSELPAPEAPEAPEDASSQSVEDALRTAEIERCRLEGALASSEYSRAEQASAAERLARELMEEQQKLQGLQADQKKLLDQLDERQKVVDEQKRQLDERQRQLDERQRQLDEQKRQQRQQLQQKGVGVELELRRLLRENQRLVDEAEKMRTLVESMSEMAAGAERMMVAERKAAAAEARSTMEKIAALEEIASEADTAKNRHEADMAAAVATIEGLLADSEARVARASKCANRDLRCARELREGLKRASRVATKEKGTQCVAAAEAAPAGPAKAPLSARTAEDAPAIDDARWHAQDGKMYAAENKSAGFLVCLAAMTQGVDEVSACISGARAVLPQTLTGEENEMIMSISAEVTSALKAVRGALMILSRTEPLVSRLPTRVEVLYDICEKNVHTFMSRVFDVASLAGMRDALRDLSKALASGLVAYSVKGEVDFCEMLGGADGSAERELERLIRAVPRMPYKEGGEADLVAFQALVCGWSDMIKAKFPWRESAKACAESCAKSCAESCAKSCAESCAKS